LTVLHNLAVVKEAKNDESRSKIIVPH